MSDLHKIQYEPENIFCVSTSLADLIVRMVSDLAQHPGHPCGLTEESYKAILDEIVDGFAAVDPLMNDHTLSSEERDALGAKFDRGLDLFKEYYFTLWY